ncbi:MAG: hypothetical protein U1C74_13530 [Phenylobacterium sp.]|nr:hypothetical protein [Phenylobacterium sp.]
MTSKAPPKAKKPKPSDVELELDAWDRFERAVEQVLHAPKDKAKPESDPTSRTA